MFGPREKKSHRSARSFAGLSTRVRKVFLLASSLRQGAKVLLNWHRSCEDGRGRGAGMKKDFGVIVFASFGDMTFRSLRSGRCALTMALQGPYPSKSGSDLSV